MAKLWAKEILKGNKTIDDVPNRLKDKVEELLKEGEGL